MPDKSIEQKIIECGKRFFKTLQDEQPSIFNKSQWIGKVMDWFMSHPDFKVNLFRFVDVFPSLETSESLTRHIKEYFGSEDQNLPSIMKWGVKGATLAAGLRGKIVGIAIRKNIEAMATQFIIGDNSKQASKRLVKLRKEGFAFVVDLLGESTVNESEADAYVNTFMELLDALGKEQDQWQSLHSNSIEDIKSKDWGYAPKIQIAVKPTALYSDIKPVNFQPSVDKVVERLATIY